MKISINQANPSRCNWIKSPSQLWVHWSLTLCVLDMRQVDPDWRRHMLIQLQWWFIGECVSSGLSRTYLFVSRSLSLFLSLQENLQLALCVELHPRIQAGQAQRKENSCQTMNYSVFWGMDEEAGRIYICKIKVTQIDTFSPCAGNYYDVYIMVHIMDLGVMRKSLITHMQSNPFFLKWNCKTSNTVYIKLQHKHHVLMCLIPLTEILKKQANKQNKITLSK